MFTDAHTHDMFNGNVSVVIDTGIADDLDARTGYKRNEEEEEREEEEEEEEGGRNEEVVRSQGHKNKNKNKNEPTLFEKAMKAAKVKMGMGKGHSTGGKGRYRKSAKKVGDK